MLLLSAHPLRIIDSGETQSFAILFGLWMYTRLLRQRRFRPAAFETSNKRARTRTRTGPIHTRPLLKQARFTDRTTSNTTEKVILWGITRQDGFARSQFHVSPSRPSCNCMHILEQEVRACVNEKTLLLIIPPLITSLYNSDLLRLYANEYVQRCIETQEKNLPIFKPRW